MLIIGCPKETSKTESRVAMVPFVCKKLVNQGIEVRVEKNAGLKSEFSDSEYEAVGAKIVDDAFKGSNVLFMVNPPTLEQTKKMERNAVVLANFNGDITPRSHDFFALEMIPRISRAQSMDILSSQSNLAGYQAVIEAVHRLNIAVPMMTTAAGTVPPAKFLIIGVGVAGLQAIATAKRLGAVVYATDIRPETEDQVKSLGGKFLKSNEIEAILPQINVVITTAVVLGKQAPILFTKAMAQKLPQSSIIVDIAGNVQEGVSAIRDNTIMTAIGHSASLLYANNLYNFFMLAFEPQTQTINPNIDDEIIKKTFIMRSFA